MRTDLYTKIVLTVIAACLVVVVLRDTPIVTPAHAAATAAPVPQNIKANYDGSINVRVVHVDGRIPVDVKSVDVPYGGFPVEVKNRYIETKPY